MLRDLLPSITTPSQIVAGRHDELVPWSNAEYLHDLLPNSEVHPLDADHFAWEQAAEEYGRLVVCQVAALDPFARSSRGHVDASRHAADCTSTATWS